METPPIRRTTAKLIIGLIRELTNSGVLLLPEYEKIQSAVSSLTKTAPKPPPVELRFLTGPQVAEKLGISFSQFKALVAEGAIPIKKHFVGAKTVRYLLAEVLEFMEQSSLMHP